MKILICDDHELFRQGLAQVLDDLDPDAELIHAATADEAIECVRTQPDVELALIDFNLPDMDGLTLLAVLREEFATVPVVMISGSEETELVRGALDGGAAGFIPKSSKSQVLLTALRLVLEGEVYVPRQALGEPSKKTGPKSRASARTKSRKSRSDVLTPRQLEVARLIARGLTNREIGGVLELAEGTVKAHVAATLEALDVSNRTEAAMALRELGLDEG